jgi:hypothetical protein
MKKLILLSILSLGIVNIYAQKNNNIVITAANIEAALTGNWIMAKIQPDDKGVFIKGFTMKGTGFGDILKNSGTGETKTIISKIFGFNQNSICFVDGDGERIVYKIVSMTKNYMQLTDGDRTIDFLRK